MTSTENMETPGRASEANHRVKEETSQQLNKSTEAPGSANLPPKKFFKSKAAQKEPAPVVSVSPPPSPPNHEHERDNFRTWLDAKLAGQNGLESEGRSASRVRLSQPRLECHVKPSIDLTHNVEC